MGVTIIKQTSLNNTTWYANRPINYIVVHYTAGVFSYKGVARNCASMFSDPSFQASADFIVDDAECVQFNGDIKNRYCWSVGGSNLGTKGGSCYGKCTNANSISIEMCCVNTSGRMTQANDQYYKLTDDTVNNTVRLVKHLMEEYGIPASRVIRHYDVTGKLCPGVKGWNADSGDESKWQEFKKRISGESTKPANETKETAHAPSTSTATKFKPPYIVRTNNKLAIFKAPNLNAERVGTCPEGSYTIVSEKMVKGKQFGELKAGGWIVITTCKKIRLQDAGVKVDTKPKKKTTTELANDIIAGKYGSGEARFAKLASEGYSDKEVDAAQKKVNELLGADVKPKKLTTKELAYAIIRGEYGCGEARFAKLKKEGYTEEEAAAAQLLVNDLMK